MTIDYQSELSGILKRKAVGPKGSRHLNEEDLPVIISALEADEVSLISKAVLVASVMILQSNELEARLLKQWESQKQFLPQELISLFFMESDSGFSCILQKILQGNDLNSDEASVAISCLLSSDIPDYQKGVLLIGERLKRESFEENIAFLQAMRQNTNPLRVQVPLLIDLSDPYDGFRRYPIYTPFVAALLAAMGFPTYCHGTKKVAPKNGDTIHKVLDLAGKNALKSKASAVQDIKNKEIGWGYIDQSVYFPALHGLVKMREKIVKRPFLATLEKLVQPLRSEKLNFLVTGYVHSHYKTELAELLKDQEPLDRALIVKGMEGSTQVDFRKESDSVMVKEGQFFSRKIETDQIAYPKEKWNECDSLAEYCLETGISALNGEKNIARKILINQVVYITNGLGLLNAKDARVKAQNLLDSGQAFHHWQNGMG